MAKITLSLSAKSNKETGKSEILIRFVGGRGMVLRAKSGIFINPKRWNDEKNELKTKLFGNEEQEVKRQLGELNTIITEEFTQTDNGLINKQWIETVIDKYHHPEKYNIIEEEPKQTFFQAFDEFLEMRKLSEVRKKNYKVVYRILKRYELYKKTTLELDTLTSKTLLDIDRFLRVEHELCEQPKYAKILKAIPESRTPLPRGQNTINAFFIKLRAFYNWCIAEGKTTNNPRIEIPESTYGTPYYITIEERKQIEQTDLTHRPQMAIQRDIFVFQCCIGCRMSDLYSFTTKSVVNGAIQYVARKTKDERPITVEVPLNSVAAEILQHYPAEEGQRLLPFISEQKYNAAIKKIFKLSGIDRIVQVLNPLTGESEPRPLYEVASSHLARRTFIGNIYKQVKDPNLVGALSGHKEGSKAFARYRDIDKEMKRDLVGLLE